MIILATIALIWLVCQVFRLVFWLIGGLFSLIGWTFGALLKGIFWLIAFALGVWVVLALAAVIAPAGIVACLVVGALIAGAVHGKDAA